MNCIVIVCDTLRIDHCGPYHRGRPLNQVTSPEQPDWIVPTPNMDRLSARGTVFDNAWCGSTPCVPARRDIYTGRYEFLERGWGPLEDIDLDLPRQVSGPPNQSLQWQMDQQYPVSYMVTDHFHLWEQGAGNYHMGYTGFDFIRGHEADAWKTEPISFPCPDDPYHKIERHHRNVHLTRKADDDQFCAQVFTQAANWLEANKAHRDFYMHIDCFDPHEPWDPPEELLKQFEPRGYNVERWESVVPYSKWEGKYTPEELRHVQARYAAMVTLTDHWLGTLLDKLDELNMWEDTVVIFTTDHGTYNGDHGRLGKLQTHQHEACGHIPFIVAHPQFGQGERRSQFVQLVDIYPTVLSLVGRPCPPDRHGIDLLPVLRDASAATRQYAISGMFGRSVTITDGEWILHQSPVPENKPLYWYGHSIAKFIHYDLGDYENGRRAVDCESWEAPTWLSNKQEDPNEYKNVASLYPEKVVELQRELASLLKEIGAPSEQLERLDLSHLV